MTTKFTEDSVTVPYVTAWHLQRFNSSTFPNIVYIHIACGYDWLNSKIYSYYFSLNHGFLNKMLVQM